MQPAYPASTLRPALEIMRRDPSDQLLRAILYRVTVEPVARHQKVKRQLQFWPL